MTIRSTLHSLLIVMLLPVGVLDAAAQSSPPAQVKPLTFENALVRLHESSDTLRAAGEEIRQREQERAATRGLYWPHVGLHAEATHLDDDVVLDLDPIRQVINTLHRLPDTYLPPFESTFQKQNFWLADVTATWPVYTGGKIQAANKAATLQVEDASHRKTAATDTLSTELARRYFGLRLATRAREVKAGVLDSLNRHLYEAKRLEEEGLIAKVERLHAQVAQAKGARELQAADQDIALARSALSSLLATSEVVDPVTELFLLSDIGPLDGYVSDAMREHPGLKRLDTQRRLADLSFKTERARWKPDVALFGMRELHTADLSLVSPTWAVGVAASVTLFDGFDRAHRSAAAKSQVARVEALDAQARRDISTLVEQKFRSLAKAREQYVSLSASVELADEIVRVRSLAFDEGFATSVEVVDAQLTLQGVRLQRLLAAYEFDVALAELLEAAGEPGRFTDLRQRADLFPER